MTFIFPLLLIGSTTSYTQSNSDEELVAAACMGYLDGFYQGDTSKIRRYLRPSLNKFGFWKSKEGQYEDDGYMSFDQAMAYAQRVKDKSQFPDDDAPKSVEVLDVMNHTAAAKVTGWWGQDYLLLSREGDRWMIHQVLWEGPLENN